MSRPAVSVLVPVYNVSQYLRQCLDSLINQTLKDIEIICVNDGSTDDSLEILEEYAFSDQRIVIVNKPNGGLPSARNAGLDVARGRYIGFVDGDDFVDANMFRRMYKTAVSNNCDIVVCGAHTYPKEVESSTWIQDVISPRDIIYRNGGEEALFYERGAKPFLWRDLVRKQLIEKNSFRLDESIVLGEDQAFQFKIFPAANRVAFISDKLYYYRNDRSDSIMNESQYKDYDSRISNHINMIESIANSWGRRLSSRDSAVRFFEWSVDFIYWDIIRLCGADKIKIAEKFCNLLVQSGYFNFIKYYTWDTRNHFEYMYALTLRKEAEPLVSVVAVLGGCGEYIQNFLDSILGQSERRVEVLLYYNGADDVTKNLVHEYMYKEPRICVHSGEWQPISAKYNDAILTAKGKYITFLSPFDYIQNLDWLKNTIAAFEYDTGVDLVGFKDGNLGKESVSNCQNADYRQFVYRTDKIRDERIKFEDYAMLTGSVFFTKYCLKSTSVYFISKYMMRGLTFKRQSVYVDEVKLILRAFVWLLQTAKDNGLSLLSRHITELLNSENYIRLITDATYGFYLDISSVDNPKEDFHAEVLSLLAEANKLADFTPGDKSVLKPLSVFISKRHKFLEKI